MPTAAPTTCPDWCQGEHPPPAGRDHEVVHEHVTAVLDVGTPPEPWTAWAARGRASVQVLVEQFTGDGQNDPPALRIIEYSPGGMSGHTWTAGEARRLAVGLLLAAELLEQVTR